MDRPQKTMAYPARAVRRPPQGVFIAADQINTVEKNSRSVTQEKHRLKPGLRFFIRPLVSLRGSSFSDHKKKMVCPTEGTARYVTR
jgi:hypothetical protein